MKGVNLDFVAQAIGIKVFLHGFGEFDYARLGHAVTRQVGHRDCACAGCHIDDASTAASFHLGQHLHRCLYYLKLGISIMDLRRMQTRVRTYSAKIDLDVLPDRGVSLQ
jgi:hypothetical protein